MEDPYSVENIDRLGDLMFQTSDNRLEPIIVWSLKHKNTQNSEPQNGPRRGLDFIALQKADEQGILQ